MNKQQLAAKIWESANKMRSQIEANENKDYILGFIFYKYLSETELRFAKKNGCTDADIKKYEKLFDSHFNTITDYLKKEKQPLPVYTGNDDTFEVKLLKADEIIKAGNEYDMEAISELQTLLSGTALQDFLFRKMGLSWDDAVYSSASLDFIDENAAILIFGKNPAKYFAGTEFKIGRFGTDDTDLIFQDVVEGNIIQMAEKVMEILKSKYLVSPIHYEGLQRKEPLEIPEPALREAIFNSIIHRNYAGSFTQMKVWNDRIELWNDGELPFGLTQEELKNSHRSKPRNKNIANVFYKAGFVESWGRGIQKICNQFAAAHLPEPVVENFCGGVNIVIPRNNPEVTTFSKEYQRYFRTESESEQAREQVTEQVKRLLIVIDKEMSVKNLMNLLELKHRPTFNQNYLQPALESQFIEQTNPDSPNSPNQKYRLTAKGKTLKEQILEERQEKQE